MKKRIRNAFAAIYARVLLLLRLDKKALKKLLHDQVILPVYFHNPSKEEFSEAIRFLKKCGFKFIGINDLIQIIEKKEPFPKGTVLITVDDGWDSNYDNMVPIAQAEQVPICIFVATEGIETGNYWFNFAKKATKIGLDFPQKNSLKKIPNSERLEVVERIQQQVTLGREAMTIAQLQIIDKMAYVQIEAHSHTHPILTSCTDEELKMDIEACKRKLENWLERPVTSFAYPNGDFGEREMALLNTLGFSLGFANNPAYIEPQHLDSRYALPRIGFLEGASQAENQCRMLGIWHKHSIKVFQN